MPTYEYVCQNCQHGWEAFQSIKDKPLKKCPKCGKMKAKRQVFGGSGFILKGGGWYSDLYASAKPGSDSSSSSTTSSSASSDSSSTTSSSASSDSSSSSKSDSSSSKSDSSGSSSKGAGSSKAKKG